MLSLKIRDFYTCMFHAVELERSVLKHPGPLPEADIERLRESPDGICEFCKELELPLSALAAERVFSCKTGREMHIALENFRHVIIDELEQKKFYGPLAKYSSYFDNPKLFGDAVFSAFPSAIEDITEAGSCLALERSTACVMHLMRAMEVCLEALANTIGVSKQNNWGAYIKEIGDKLEKRAKSSGSRSSQEQFYAAAAIQFDHVRRAWRNPALHVEKNYSVDRAEQILLAVKSFMDHLATQISESDQPSAS